MISFDGRPRYNYSATFALKINSPDYAGRLMASLRTAFIIFTVRCILGVFASLARGRMKKDGENG
jgi:ABC-type spermidine/putrescine transport system permease subunit II